MLKAKNWKELVREVAEKGLEPAENLTEHEKTIDEYIKTHSLAYVLNDGVGHYYIRYEHTGEWLRLSWYKLRRDCPVIFHDSRSYLIGQALVMKRLKAAGRVFKNVRYREVEFD